jgi:hypothetical protein
MATDEIADFFEGCYNHELEQKQNLDSVDGLLIGIVGALIGVGAYYLSLIPASSWCVSCVFFWVLIIGFFAALVGGLICCIASIWPQEKAYIASPKEWGDYVDGLTTYHATYQKGADIDDRVCIDLAALRRRQYVNAGEINRKLIIRKHGYHVRAKRFIAAAVVLMLLNAVPGSMMQIAKDAADTKAGTKNEQRSTPNRRAAAARPAKPTQPAPASAGKTNAAGNRPANGR